MTNYFQRSLSNIILLGYAFLDLIPMCFPSSFLIKQSDQIPHPAVNFSRCLKTATLQIMYLTVLLRR